MSTRKMRTRFYDSLRNREIEEYLGRSDIVFLPMVREFFDETKCSILHIDFEPYYGPLSWEEFNKMLWGAYSILSRLDEIPRDQVPAERTYPKAIVTGRFHFGAYYEKASDHGWGPDHPLADAERGARAREGIALIDNILGIVDPPALVAKMKELDVYLQQQVLPKYRDHLP